MLRGLSPLPTMASCASPVSRGMTCDQVRLASSETRNAPKYPTSKNQPIALGPRSTEQEVQLNLREEALRGLAWGFSQLDEGA